MNGLELRTSPKNHRGAKPLVQRVVALGFKKYLSLFPIHKKQFFFSLLGAAPCVCVYIEKERKTQF